MQRLLRPAMEVHVRDYVQLHAIVDAKVVVGKHVPEVAKVNVVETAPEVVVLIVQKDVAVAVQGVALTNAG